MLLSRNIFHTSLVTLSILSLLSSSRALILHVATSTSICHNHGLMYKSIVYATPRPTANVELRVRQAQGSLATCGFINGDLDLAVTCNTNYYCATTSTYVGCCEKNNCLDIFTKCFDLLGAACDQACQNNPQNLVCPSSLPYCARYNYEGGSVGLGCARLSGYTTTVLLTTKTAIGTFNPTSSSSTAATPVSNNTSASSGLSTGATAGIAVGATLGVVAILLLAWFCWRRNKKSKSKARQELSAAPPVTSYFDAKEVSTNSNQHRGSMMSELPSSPRAPLSPDLYAAKQPSPGLPKYSQNPPTTYHEMAGNERPMSYPATELSSSRV